MRPVLINLVAFVGEGVGDAAPILVVPGMYVNGSGSALPVDELHRYVVVFGHPVFPGEQRDAVAGSERVHATDEFQPQVTVGFWVSLYEVLTDRRAAQRLLRNLVAADVEDPKRLDVLSTDIGSSYW